MTGIATNNLPLAETAPGVTPAILMAGGAAALEAYALALKYIWIVGAYSAGFVKAPADPRVPVIPFVVLAMLSCFLLTGVGEQMNYLVDRPAEAIHYHVDHALEHAAPVRRFLFRRSSRALTSTTASEGLILRLVFVYE